MKISKWMETQGYEALTGDRGHERMTNQQLAAIRLTSESSYIERCHAQAIIAEYLYRRDITSARHEARYEAGYLITDYFKAIA
mgnify:CR=1 FL=1